MDTQVKPADFTLVSKFQIGQTKWKCTVAAAAAAVAGLEQHKKGHDTALEFDSKKIETHWYKKASSRSKLRR